MENVIFGKNAVLSALTMKRVEMLYMQNGFSDERIEVLLDNIPTKTLTKRELDELTRGKHQGIAAKIRPYDFTSFDRVIELAKRANKSTLVVLDGIEDPHNLGAIIRSCDALGASGIIIKKHNQVALTATVAKVSTGAIEHVPISQVTNLTQAINKLKEHGFWIVGFDGSATIDYDTIDYSVPIVAVIGSEGKGISRLVLSACDYVVKIPMYGHVNSLNASNALAVSLSMINHKRK